jgi:hypothetical protein
MNSEVYFALYVLDTAFFFSFSCALSFLPFGSINHSSSRTFITSHLPLHLPHLLTFSYLLLVSPPSSASELYVLMTCFWFGFAKVSTKTIGK